MHIKNFTQAWPTASAQGMGLLLFMVLVLLLAYIFVSSKLPAECWAQRGSNCISLSLISASLVPRQRLARTWHLVNVCWVELKTLFFIVLWHFALFQIL